MSIGIGIFKACSIEAFHERLETSKIKRQIEMEKAVKPRKSDTRRGKVMREIEDRKMAKQLGVSLSDLE